jgi:hypothetical protein
MEMFRCVATKQIKLPFSYDVCAFFCVVVCVLLCCVFGIFQF